MSDISTFDRFKNWLLVGSVGIIISLLGLIAAENRQRIERMEIRMQSILETRLEDQSQRIDAQAQRIATIEATQKTQIEEIFRWLSRIDSKLPNSSKN